MDSTGHTMHLLLRWIVRVVNRNTCKIGTIAFYLDTLSNHELIFLTGSLFNKLSVIHVSLEWIGSSHLQAGVIVIFPSHSFIDVPIVFY